MALLMTTPRFDFADGSTIPVYYNVSYGDLVVQEGSAFGQAHITTFSIPFIPGSATSSTITREPTTPPVWTPFPTSTSSLAPTATIQPSPSPTVSPLPTITCYWVDIVVVFDAFPLETSWQIEKIINSGDNKVLKTFNGTSGEENELRNESMCLEGEQTYQFAIYDDYGDGIIAPGHYNVTSNGSLCWINRR